MSSANEIPLTLRGLVEQYSPSGQEQPAVAWLVARMQALGFTQSYRDQAGNAIGVLGTGSRQIVLLGHIDTVSGEIPPRLEGDHYYGRGSVDAKGPLAVFVDAAAALNKEDANQAGWQVVVVGAVGEERDSQGARFVASQYQPEYAIIGEPSRWERITVGYKGSAWVEVTTRRALSHSARKDESACEAAFASWARIRHWVDAFNSGREAAFDQVQVSLRGFHSGNNGFEEWAALQISVRLPLDLPPAALYQELSTQAAPALIQPQGFAIPAYRGEKNNALVRAFLSGIRVQTGQPGFVLKTGTADMNIVAPIWNCPAVAYGPGDSALDHTPHEHISLREYHCAVRVLLSVLQRLTGSR